jgi:hypothetical protein
MLLEILGRTGDGSSEAIMLDEMEQMVGMVPGAIMGLVSFLFGIAGFIWPAVNAEVYAK